MPVLISLLRGVNVGGHRKVKMDELRALYESLGFKDVQTYINSGNVLFRTAGRDLARLRQRIETTIESACGFRSDVVLRTPADLKQVIARNPFAARPGLDASRLAIHLVAAARRRPPFAISRCVAFTRKPACARRLRISSAIITERWCPPVQPNAMVR
jgi:uncharacterized protein (DUF1697 family)